MNATNVLRAVEKGGASTDPIISIGPKGPFVGQGRDVLILHPDGQMTLLTKVARDSSYLSLIKVTVFGRILLLDFTVDIYPYPDQ